MIQTDPRGVDWFALSCVAGLLLSVLVILNRASQQERGPAAVNPSAEASSSPIPNMTPFIPGH